MSSLLSYISRKHNLKKEDLASGAIAFLLETEGVCRQSFQEAMNSFDVRLPKHFSVKTQPTDQFGCRPDIELRDGAEIAVRIECKFNAPFTENQKYLYINALHAGALLIFVAPPARRAELRAKIRQFYPASNIGFDRWSIAEQDVKIALISWSDLMFKMGYGGSRLSSRVDFYLSDLGSLCDVQRVSSFRPFSGDDFGKNHAELFQNLMWIAFELADKCFDSVDEDGKFGRAWSRSATGRDGYLEGFRCWIGIEADRWVKDGDPLWLWLPSEIGDEPLLGIPTQEDPEGGRWLPLGVTLGLNLDKLLEDLGDQVYRVRGELLRIKSSKPHDQ